MIDFICLRLCSAQNSIHAAVRKSIFLQNNRIVRKNDPCCIWRSFKGVSGNFRYAFRYGINPVDAEHVLQCFFILGKHCILLDNLPDRAHGNIHSRQCRLVCGNKLKQNRIGYDNRAAFHAAVINFRQICRILCFKHKLTKLCIPWQRHPFDIIGNRQLCCAIGNPYIFRACGICQNAICRNSKDRIFPRKLITLIDAQIDLIGIDIAHGIRKPEIFHCLQMIIRRKIHSLHIFRHCKHRGILPCIIGQGLHKGQLLSGFCGLSGIFYRLDIYPTRLDRNHIGGIQRKTRRRLQYMPPCCYRVFPRNRLAIFTPAGEKGFQSVLPKQTALIIIKVYLCANRRIGFVTCKVGIAIQHGTRINLLPLILQCLAQNQQTGLLQTIGQGSLRIGNPRCLCSVGIFKGKAIGNVNPDDFCILRDIYGLI